MNPVYVFPKHAYCRYTTPRPKSVIHHGPLGFLYLKNAFEESLPRKRGPKTRVLPVYYSP